MGNGGHSRLGKKFSKSNSERNMHRDRETILGSNADVEFIDEVINRTFQIIGQSLFFGYETVPLVDSPYRSLIHLFSKTEVCLGTTD